MNAARALMGGGISEPGPIRMLAGVAILVWLEPLDLDGLCTDAYDGTLVYGH